MKITVDMKSWIFNYTPYDIAETLHQLEEDGLYLTYRTCLDDNHQLIIIVYSQEYPAYSYDNGFYVL